MSLPAVSARSRPTVFPCSISLCDNVYFVADSNHGFKMIGVGALVAEELCGKPSKSTGAVPLLARYEKGELHPVSNSPVPVELRTNGTIRNSRVVLGNLAAQATSRTNQEETHDRPRSNVLTPPVVPIWSSRSAKKSTSSASPTFITSSFRSPAASSAKGFPPITGSAPRREAFQLVYGSTANLFIDRHGDYIGYGPEAMELVGIPGSGNVLFSCHGISAWRVFSVPATATARNARTQACCAHLRLSRKPEALSSSEFQEKYKMDFRVGTEPEMMWLKRGADGKPDGGFSNPYCYHIDQFESLRPVFMQGHRILPRDGAGHDPGRPRGRARSAGAELDVRRRVA